MGQGESESVSPRVPHTDVPAGATGDVPRVSVLRREGESEDLVQVRLFVNKPVGVLKRTDRSVRVRLSALPELTRALRKVELTEGASHDDEG